MKLFVEVFWDNFLFIYFSIIFWVARILRVRSLRVRILRVRIFGGCILRARILGLRILHVRSPQSAVRTPHSTLRSPHSSLLTPHSALRFFTTAVICLGPMQRMQLLRSALLQSGSTSRFTLVASPFSQCFATYYQRLLSMYG